jgi:HAD superfamily PSPase-like hydrolase
MKVKMVGFDWDGTIGLMSNRSPWAFLHEYLGSKREVVGLRELYLDGKISYIDWSKSDVKGFKKFGLTKQKMLKIIKENFVMHKGAAETINQLRENGIKTCIISGGIKDIYDYASKRFDFEVDHTSFSARFIFDKNGKLRGARYNDFDYARKVEALKIFCKMEGVSLNETVFVGDSHNDVDIFKACTGIAFNHDSEELREQAKHVLKGNDMRELLQYIH